MKTLSRTVGAILVLMGAVWFLQGISVLPGSFMSGQTRWAVNGVVAIAIGLFLILAPRRPRR